MTATALQEIEVATPRRRWPCYPDYKPTGLPWLPKAPTHWSAKRLRYAVRFPTKGEVRGLPLDTLVSFVPMEAVGEYGGLSLDQTRPIEEVLNGYTYFRNGDVLVAKITPCFENGKGALAEGLENGLGFGTTELHVLRAGAEILPKYLFYLTLGEHFRKLGTAEMYGAGGQKRVPERFIQNLKHPLPPLDEQRAIAAFLDRETARIDELIAKKQRLIELLKEKRQAVISRAVTKGLDPTAPMKPSGIDWLGEIPAHWEIRRLRFLFDNLNHRRIPLSGEDRSYRAKLYPYYGASGIIDAVDEYIFDEPLILVAEDGANLLSRSTPLAFVADGKYWVNNHAHIIRPRNGPIRYWEALLQTFDFTPLVSGSAQPKLTIQNLNTVSLPVPPLTEQQRIGEFIVEMNAKLDVMIDAIAKASRRLSEYRSALITAAVTGQIDVRHYQAEAAS
jgi:type I restriction enzyme S subunit